MTDDELATVVLGQFRTFPEDRDTLRLLILAAIKAAKKRAAETAREQKKRYSCRRLRGVCDAIADTIERGES